MRRLIFTAIAICMFSSIALAIPSYDLVPDIAQPTDGYPGGTTLSIDVNYVNDTDQTHYLRLIMMNFVDSSPELVLSNLALDLSTALADGALYFQDVTGLLAQAALQSSCHFDCTVNVDPFSSIRVATIDVELPDADVVPRTYLLDAMNADDGNANNSGRITYGFANPVELFATDGTLGGGRLEFTVIPEPATLTLLGIAALIVATRRVRTSVGGSHRHGHNTT